MLTQPKKTKYRKSFKPRGLPHNSNKSCHLGEYNFFAIIAAESGYLNAKQMEAARQNIRRKISREGKLLLLLSPNIPITKTASSARMGKGKGKVNHWVTSIAAGQKIFILYGIDREQGIPALYSGANKLPLKLKIREL
uniref:Ribosomal protein L16 n=1 Tax=Phaeophyceae sp. TaxID=2249243 RepID=A0A8E8PF62_9PHAE|nr:ribosomal protein L16 [Phaeophyceae sp.]